MPSLPYAAPSAAVGASEPAVLLRVAWREMSKLLACLPRRRAPFTRMDVGRGTISVVPDYDLTRLGNRAFEQLVVSLCRCELGSGMQVFGDGPDGGREATFDGTIEWSRTALASTVAGDRWSGFTVLQSKFMLSPKARPRDNAVWLQGQIREEIARWSEAAESGARVRMPDYLIFLTNVDLSSVARIGGIDTVERLLADLIGPDSDAYRKGLRVRATKIWHADQIRTMLDAHQDIRWAFPGLLTPGDVIAAVLRDRPQVGSLALDDPLRREMVAGLAAERWLRLSQAGGAGGDKMFIDDVVVDLPALIDTAGLGGEALGPGRTSAGTEAVRAIGQVLDRGDAVLRPTQPGRPGRAGVVLVGGPGQGKTTLSQFLAQVYRSAMLLPTDVKGTARTIAEATEAALDRLGRRLPGNRRWPVRIDLAKYAEQLSTGAETSLLRWIASRVSDRADSQATPSDLHSWLRLYPWVVILDGLDEVPSLDVRRQVYEQIEMFLAKADDQDADLLTVVTTRPMGYDERLPEEHFEHLHLQPLPVEEAGRFAAWLSQQRFAGDPEKQAEVGHRLRAAAADPTTARLMETPLQITIMSMIVEKFPILPPDRYTLFDLYYRTVYDREVAKGLVVSRFLSDNRQHVDRIHEQVGLLLQVQSENAQGADAVLPSDELRKLAVTWLEERGYERQDAERTADRLVDAALMRLVLLVPREAGIGFEIRTLQELMAARAVARGTDEEVISRLRVLANSPHWRNTWLLAAGNLLVASERFENLLARLLHSLAEAPAPLARRLSPAPGLAADMLRDGLADRRPGFERALVQVLLTVVDYPPTGSLDDVAAAVNRLMGGSYHRLVVERFGGTAQTGPLQRAAAAAVLSAMRSLAGDIYARKQSIDLMINRLSMTNDEREAFEAYWFGRPAPSSGAGSLHSVVAIMVEQTDQLGLSEEQHSLLMAGLAALDTAEVRLTTGAQPFAVIRNRSTHDPSPLLEVVHDPDLNVALDLALGALPPGYWPIQALVASAVQIARSRRPVGAEMVSTVRSGP
jgi:hypothetical protein